MQMLLSLWLMIRRSGWFARGAPGGLFPFPSAWQGWALMAAFVAVLVGTTFLPGESGWVCRIAACVGYVALGVATYE